MVLTIAAAGCGSNAPDNRGSNTGTGPGGNVPPANETAADAGAPPPSTALDAGPVVTPVVDAGPAYRYGSCLQTMQCFQAASCYATSCSAACLNDSAPDIRDEATALLSCVEANGCRDSIQCIGQKCISEGSACGLAGEGTATCAQTLTCAIGCDRSDTGCYAGCLGSASPAARQKVQAIVGCAVQSGCGQDQACILSRCGTEIQACMGS
ncbi:MAG: hypothetical protein HYY84_12990 [Deltaproteobacteria bacterium]|nr:hypothetical protein [Deltaproteobacteria bacterium]